MDAALPPSTRPFFQEYDFARLNPQDHATLIMERILAYGNRAEVRWLFDTYGETRLGEWLARDGARLLTKRRYTLWCRVLSVTPDVAPKKGAWSR